MSGLNVAKRCPRKGAFFCSFSIHILFALCSSFQSICPPVKSFYKNNSTVDFMNKVWTKYEQPVHNLFTISTVVF